MTTWIALRAAGIGAFVMLWLSVVWGLIGTTGALGPRVSKASAVTVHRFMGTVGLVLLTLHIGLLLVDPFMPFAPRAVLVPGASTFKPIPVALGVVAMYLMVFVLVSSWLRRFYSAKVWRKMHLLATPAYVVALLHGLFTGTDTARPWIWWSYLATGATVVFLLVVRGLTVGFRPPRAVPPVRAPRAATRPGTAGVGAARRDP